MELNKVRERRGEEGYPVSEFDDLEPTLCRTVRALLFGYKCYEFIVFIVLNKFFNSSNSSLVNIY